MKTSSTVSQVNQWYLFLIFLAMIIAISIVEQEKESVYIENEKTKFSLRTDISLQSL